MKMQPNLHMARDLATKKKELAAEHRRPTEDEQVMAQEEPVAPLKDEGSANKFMA